MAQVPQPPAIVGPARRSASIRRTSVPALLAVALLASARCATIAHGTTEGIQVESDPPGAVVSLNCVQNSITNVGTTPVTVEVQRKSKSCAIEIAKEGYLPAHVPLQRTFSGVYVGNLLVGGVVGLVADAASGAMYNQGPSVVRVNLVAASRPPVVTLPSPQPEAEPQTQTQTQRRTLKDREGREVAWLADDGRELAACAHVGRYDASQVTSEGRAAIADEVLRLGGDTLFNPNGGTVFDIYRCGAESGIAQNGR